MGSKYEHLSQEELIRVLEARDRRDATKFGLVWEANEIERDKALNNDFVALDLVPELCIGKPGWRNLIIEGDNFDALRYARVSPTTAIVQVGGQVMVQVLEPNGQTHLLQVTPPPSPGATAEQTGGAMGGFTLELLSGARSLKDLFPSAGEGAVKPGEICAIQTAEGYRYALREDVPHRFKTHVVSADNEVAEDECAQRFVVSAGDILRALNAKIKVEERTLEVFSRQIEMAFTNAMMDPEQAARAALKVLTRNDVFDCRELRRALIRKLKAVLRELAMDEAENDDKVSHMLNVILCGHPELLFEAQKAALAAHCEVEEAEEELPAIVATDNLLPTARLNVYRVFPPGLNSWELPFAQFLDGDTQNIVRWWHRNLPHQPWSVQVTLDNGSGFFPDFVVGINGRQTELGGLLADPKYFFEIAKEVPKSYSQHPSYGRVLILNRQGSGQWFAVRYDEHRQRPVLDKEFRLADAAGY